MLSYFFSRFYRKRVIFSFAICHADIIIMPSLFTYGALVNTMIYFRNIQEAAAHYDAGSIDCRDLRNIYYL